MYTLNLKEVELTPQIDEKKIFENNDEIKLERLVVEYITKNYQDTYKNPITLGRKVREAIKDEKGQTESDRSKKSTEEFVNSVDKENQARRKTEEFTDEEMDSKFNELSAWNRVERDKVWDEYNPKIEEAENEEERRKLDEEMKLKLDDVEFEHSQKFDTLSEEKRKKVESLTN
ncbi:MAG TPA: hypothetical protein ENI76_07270 [Ignavibacteria bacterium]|nr:hypothetical protein [Ignavibacteria bacterium]